MCKTEREQRAPIDVRMQRSTADQIPDTPNLPSSLSVRIAEAEDAESLAALLGRAYPTEVWEVSETKQELFGDKSVKAVLVVVQGTQILATASLQIHANKPTSGQLRWVATEQHSRRQGLAQTVVAQLLTLAAKADCKDVWLKTTNDLTSAIKMYLKLGFEPVVSTEEDQKVWDNLLSSTL